MKQNINFQLTNEKVQAFIEYSNVMDNNYIEEHIVEEQNLNKKRKI